MPRARRARESRRVEVTLARGGRIVGVLLACASIAVAAALGVPALLAPVAARGGASPSRPPAVAPRPSLPPIAAAVPDDYRSLAEESRALGAAVVDRHGDKPQAIALEGVILSETGDIAGAAAAWRRLADAHPANAEGWYRLGLLAVREGRDDDAVTMLARARDLDPALPDVQAHLGRALLKQDRVEDAAAVLETGSATDRGAAVRLFHLGHARLRQGRAEEALAAFRDAVAQAPTYTGAWYGVATAAARLGREGDAEMARERFRSLKQRDAEGAAGDHTRDETLRLRRSLSRWYASAGRIAALDGDATTAGTFWKRGLAVDPDVVDNRRALEELSRRQGRPAGTERPGVTSGDASDRGGR